MSSRIKKYCDKEITYLVSFRDKKWCNWLFVNMLKDKEVFFLKKELTTSFNSNSPLLLRFNQCDIVKVAPIDYRSSRSAFQLFFNNEDTIN